MLPDFASDIQNILFEPMDEITAKKLRDDIYKSISKWEDRIIIKGVDVTPNYEQNQYFVKMLFKLKSTDQTIYNFSKILDAK